MNMEDRTYGDVTLEKLLMKINNLSGILKNGAVLEGEKLHEVLSPLSKSSQLVQYESGSKKMLGCSVMEYFSSFTKYADGAAEADEETDRPKAVKNSLLEMIMFDPKGLSKEDHVLISQTGNSAISMKFLMAYPVVEPTDLSAEIGDEQVKFRDMVVNDYRDSNGVHKYVIFFSTDEKKENGYLLITNSKNDECEAGLADLVSISISKDNKGIDRLSRDKTVIYRISDGRTKDVVDFKTHKGLAELHNEVMGKNPFYMSSKLEAYYNGRKANPTDLLTQHKDSLVQVCIGYLKEVKPKINGNNVEYTVKSRKIAIDKDDFFRSAKVLFDGDIKKLKTALNLNNGAGEVSYYG